MECLLSTNYIFFSVLLSIVRSASGDDTKHVLFLFAPWDYIPIVVPKVYEALLKILFLCGPLGCQTPFPFHRA